ncbi:MAG: hypothetical protein ACJAUG_003661 [Halioglobus sp.]|jgi:hypothetical protein
MNEISRRDFSGYLGRGAVAIAAVSGVGFSSLYAIADDSANSTPDEISKNIDMATLAQYAYFIVPLLDPSHIRYQRIAQNVLNMTGQAPALTAMKNAGIAALSATGKGSWSTQSSSDRAGTVKLLAGTPFFNFLHWSTAEIVMREPKLWEQLGYQGSSIEQGGYLNRGFDDIDWLPVRRGRS